MRRCAAPAFVAVPRNTTKYSFGPAPRPACRLVAPASVRGFLLTLTVESEIRGTRIRGYQLPASGSGGKRLLRMDDLAAGDCWCGPAESLRQPRSGPADSWSGWWINCPCRGVSPARWRWDQRHSFWHDKTSEGLPPAPTSVWSVLPPAICKPERPRQGQFIHHPRWVAIARGPDPTRDVVKNRE